VVKWPKMQSYIKRYLAEYKKDKEVIWSEEDEYVLVGAINLFEATGEKYLKSFVLSYIDNYVTTTGEVQNANIAIGRILFFAYEQTQEEKYKKAIQQLEVQLKEQPWRKGLFSTLSFYTMCENKLGKKQAYKDIIEQFQEIKKEIEKGDTRYSSIYFLLGIIDTLEEMSEQIYEYYHELKTIFRNILKDELPYNIEVKEPFVVAIIILKACRMKVLLAEKYKKIGIDILEGVTQIELEHLNPKRSGSLMIAYAQILLME
jgi:Predicted unsaturated glucuronyl hydrolase involved in regulation of bacterial surface properties, and related proteins